MSVYNTNEEYLRPAIESILCQTYSKFEFVIIDDCSNEETQKILSSYHDRRIRIHRNEKNLGLTKSLNIGLGLCEGDYVARMDSDDIAFPNRLEVQLDYIEKNDFIAIGAEYEFYPKRKYQRFITENLEKQRIRMIFSNVGIIHSTAFFNKKKMLSFGIRYNEDYKKSQDYGLWCDMISKGFALGTCPYVLLKWRESPGQISKVNFEEQKECRNRIRKNYIKKILNISDEICDYIICNFDGVIDYKNTDLKRMSKYLCEIINRNKKEYRLIEKELCFVWAVQMLKIIKTYKSTKGMLCEMTFKLLKPSNVVYFFEILKKERKVYS